MAAGYRCPGDNASSGGKAREKGNTVTPGERTLAASRPSKVLILRYHDASFAQREIHDVFVGRAPREFANGDSVLSVGSKTLPNRMREAYRALDSTNDS